MTTPDASQRTEAAVLWSGTSGSSARRIGVSSAEAEVSSQEHAEVGTSVTI